MDDQLLLSISGKPEVKVEVTDLALAEGTAALVIEGFRQAMLEYLEYVSDAPHVSRYTDGRIYLVAPR